MMAHGCQRTGSTWQYNVLIELGKLWCTQRNFSLNCFTLGKNHHLPQGRLVAGNCKLFTTCRSLADATLSAVHSPWWWIGFNKTNLETGEIVDSCMKRLHSNTAEFAYVNPYPLLAVYPVEAVQYHARALDMDINRKEAETIIQTINASFATAAELPPDLKLRDNSTGLKKLINKDHRYSHSNTFDSAADKAKLDEMGMLTDHWCADHYEKLKSGITALSYGSAAPLRRAKRQLINLRGASG